MLSLALPGTSWAHRLPVGLKFGALAAAMLGLTWLTAPLPLAAALVATAGLYLGLGRRAVAEGARALRPVLWIVAFIAAWQLWEGAPMLGLVLGLRICTMVALANFVTLVTPLPDLIALIERLAHPLARFGLSPRLPALAVALVLRFIPVLRGRMELLALSWRARSRHRPGPRLIAPLVLSLLDDSDHLADALRARGGLAPRPAPPTQGRD